MTKTKIITTGINGLVGSCFKKRYGEQYEIINLGLDEKTPTDITDLAAIEEIVQANPDAEAILHLAAYTDVNGAQAQNGDKNGLAYRVNVLGTKNIAEMAASYNKYLMVISTAYVFDGEKSEPYIETDQPRAIEWYGQTKLWAEEEVLARRDLQAAILRIDQPFSLGDFEKKDVLHKIMAGLETDSLYPQFNDHYFGPTYIDDFARVMDFFLRQRLTGIYHATSGESWSDYKFARLIAEAFGFDLEKVKEGSLTEYLKTAARPYQRNTALNNAKLLNVLDFELQNIAEIIKKK
jgi:dTDP-4-dehydrorhamnose reductase